MCNSVTSSFHSTGFALNAAFADIIIPESPSSHASNVFVNIHAALCAISYKWVFGFILGLGFQYIMAARMRRKDNNGNTITSCKDAHAKFILAQCVECWVLRQLSENLEKRNLHTMEALKIAEVYLEVVKEKSKGDKQTGF